MTSNYICDFDSHGPFHLILPQEQRFPQPLRDVQQCLISHKPSSIRGLRRVDAEVAFLGYKGNERVIIRLEPVVSLILKTLPHPQFTIKQCAGQRIAVNRLVEP